MTSWKMRGAAVLAALALTAAGCEENGITDDPTPGVNDTMPTPAEDGLDTEPTP